MDKHSQHQVFGPETYAQHGDDIYLANIFKLIDIDRPSYLDLGAHHPYAISNTALFYERGARGVNVEANAKLIEEFKRLRPEDKNLCVGVAAEAGTRRFHMYDDTSGLNGFSEAEVKMNVDAGARVQATIDLPCVTINDIVRDHCGGAFPDLLCLDIEGLDLEVLESAKFGHTRPKVICAEVRPWAAERMKNLLANWDYFCYARVMANLVFVQERYRGALY